MCVAVVMVVVTEVLPSEKQRSGWRTGSVIDKVVIVMSVATAGRSDHRNTRIKERGQSYSQRKIAVKVGWKDIEIQIQQLHLIFVYLFVKKLLGLQLKCVCELMTHTRGHRCTLSNISVSMVGLENTKNEKS